MSQQSAVRQSGEEYIQMCEVWDEAEEIDEGREMAEATVDDKVPYGISKVSERKLERELVVVEFFEVNLEDAEGFDVGEVGESLENALVLGFVWRRVAQPPNVRRQNFGSFFRYILAPPFELRFVLKPDVMKQVTLALRSPCFGNESAGLERSAKLTNG